MTSVKLCQPKHQTEYQRIICIRHKFQILTSPNIPQPLFIRLQGSQSNVSAVNAPRMSERESQQM